MTKDTAAQLRMPVISMMRQHFLLPLMAGQSGQPILKQLSKRSSKLKDPASV